MCTHFRIGWILALSLLVGFAYSPASFADKNNNSNSNNNNSNSSNSDDKKDKDKDNQNQNNQGSNRNRHRDDNQNSNSQPTQKIFQGNSDKQGSSNNSQPMIKSGQPSGQFLKNPQFQGTQKQSPFQNLQKQNNQQQNNQQPFLQQQSNKNNWQNQSHKDHKEIHNFVTKFGGPEPFSKKWYDDHPKAWHHNHHDHDDAWKAVTAAGIVGFLGWEAYHPRTVVVYEPVPYDTLFVSRPGVVIDPSRGDWAPLGTFSLMLGPGDASTRMLDLAVDHFGHIRGSYYDMVSGASYNVAGIVDQRSQYAQWSLESNRQLTFYTPLGEMMQPQGAVNVQLPSGERQQWQLVRMENSGY